MTESALPGLISFGDTSKDEARGMSVQLKSAETLPPVRGESIVKLPLIERVSVPSELCATSPDQNPSVTVAPFLVSILRFFETFTLPPT